jgi:Zn-finger nucleic acid-binding protein
VVLMQAQTLHCQSCGAAVASDVPVCEHCGARLATISCPSCFGMMFRDMKFCPHCGTPAVEWQAGDTSMACASCGITMLRGMVGPNQVYECGKCFGIWLDTATFERICRAAEQQALAVPGGQLGAPTIAVLERVRYRRCPVCRDLMNRVNFAHCSGVIVDVCSAHGTWFDRDELQRIVEFIRGGGLDRVREKQKAELEAEARRLEALRREVKGEGASAFGRGGRGDLLTTVVGSTGGLLGRWLR